MVKALLGRLSDVTICAELLGSYGNDILCGKIEGEPGDSRMGWMPTYNPQIVLRTHCATAVSRLLAWSGIGSPVQREKCYQKCGDCLPFSKTRVWYPIVRSPCEC